MTELLRCDGCGNDMNTHQYISDRYTLSRSNAMGDIDDMHFHGINCIKLWLERSRNE